jgi:iron(III) transport system substrate-binding protein
VLPALEEYPDLGWSYIADGQPILLRRMAITRSAASPNSAKLMLDFILSQEGQLALDEGGLTPYRNDILGIPAQHLDLVAQQTGNENIILFSLDDRIMDNAKRNLFIKRWNSAIPQTATP